VKILDVQSLAIPEVKTIRFARFLDERGYFAEPFRRSDFDGHPALGFLAGVRFVQMNESRSRQNVVRGLHFQWNPLMGKLVRTLTGRMIDLVVDIRRDSPTLGRGIMHDMPAHDESDWGEWIWVPPGFAHGNFFESPSRIEYYCTGEYSPGCEAGIAPTAEDIDWSLAPPALVERFRALTRGGDVVMSDKDRRGVSLSTWLHDPRSAEFVYGRV
jgi:dTDP-4-dehydrorhamnose 3,5-epimerase